MLTINEENKRREEIEKKFKEMGIDPAQQEPTKVMDYSYLHIPSPQDKSEKLSFDNATNKE